MKVLTICEGGGVSEYYRTLTPYRILAEAGEIELTANDGVNPAIISHLDNFDAVIFSRPDTPEHSLILLHAKMQGLRVIVDIDDNLFLLPPSIGLYHAWHQRGTGKIQPRLYHLKQNIKLADVLTVSTEALGRQLCQGEPHRLREDYLVLPNMILESDWRDIEPAPKPEGETWVGWWGIYNHWDDWRDVAPYIEPVIEAYPDTRLVLLGMPELSHLFPALRKTNQLVIAPFVPPSELAAYREIVAAFDVALAPTAYCPFNESKSDLKLLQYGAAGVASIASKTTYSAWNDEALTLEVPAQWGQAVELLLENSLSRRHYADDLHQRVMAERTYEAQYPRWRAALGLQEPACQNNVPIISPS